MKLKTLALKWGLQIFAAAVLFAILAYSLLGNPR